MLNAPILNVLNPTPYTLILLEKICAPFVRLPSGALDHKPTTLGNGELLYQAPTLKGGLGGQ